jgi:hypothetical protein
MFQWTLWIPQTMKRVPLRIFLSAYLNWIIYRSTDSWVGDNLGDQYYPQAEVATNWMERPLNVAYFQTVEELRLL